MRESKQAPDACIGPDQQDARSPLTCDVARLCENADTARIELCHEREIQREQPPS